MKNYFFLMILFMPSLVYCQLTNEFLNYSKIVSPYLSNRILIDSAIKESMHQSSGTIKIFPIVKFYPKENKKNDSLFSAKITSQASILSMPSKIIYFYDLNIYILFNHSLIYCPLISSMDISTYISCYLKKYRK